MREAINILTGFILGLFVVAGVSIIGVAIYAALPNVIGIVILGLLLILSLWLGVKIFKQVQKVGSIEFLTAARASPDLDNLVLTEDSETKKRNPEELEELLKSKNNLFKGGTIRIYGDWFGKPHDNYHSIESADFDRELNRLTLKFKEGERLEIHNPNQIFESLTFLKILTADRVRLTWFYYGKTQEKENQYFIDYKHNDKKIETETNVDWYKPQFDVSLGQPALMIFG